MFIGVDSWFAWEMQELGAFPAVSGGLLCQAKRTAIRSWSELSGHGDGRLSSQFNLRDLPEFTGAFSFVRKVSGAVLRDKDY